MHSFCDLVPKGSFLEHDACQMLFRVAYALPGPVERALHVWGWGGWVGSSRCFRAKAERGVLLQSANRDKKSDIRNPSGKRSVKQSSAACPCLVLSPWKFRLIIHRNPTQGILPLGQNCNLITSKNQFLLTISMATSVPTTTLPGEHLCSLKAMAHAPKAIVKDSLADNFLAHCASPA